MLQAENFFDLHESRFADIFSGTEYVWEALKKIKEYTKTCIEPNVSPITRNGCMVEKTLILFDNKIYDSGFTIEQGDASKEKLTVTLDGKILSGASVVYAGSAFMDDSIEIGKGCAIESGALIKGPAIIGDTTEIRQGAYLRGNTLIGSNCVVGHTTEIKSSILLGGSKAGHFAYIGDSILGKVNLGAGTKLANLKIIDTQVLLRINDNEYETGLRKFGAILGDGVETGCNSVTMPGSLLSKGVLAYPNTTVSGYTPPDTIIKLRQKQTTQKRGQ